MPKQPTLTPNQILRILQRAGFIVRRTTGSHYVLSKPDNNKLIIVPYHNKDLPPGTLHSIIKMSGLDLADFAKK